jgi:hypothetical protein
MLYSANSVVSTEIHTKHIYARGRRKIEYLMLSLVYIN